MASGHSDGTVCLWDAITGARRRTLSGHSKEVTSLSFSPNSSLLVSTSKEKTIRLWNAITGTKVQNLWRIYRVGSAAFMPNGKRIIFTESQGPIYLWDIIENKQVWVSRRTGEDSSLVRYGHVTISPDGKRIAGSDGVNRKNVWLLDTENGKPLRNAKRFDKRVMSIAFSPNSKLLAVALVENIEVWNVATGATRRISTKDNVNEVLFSPDGKTIAIAVSGAIQIFNVASGENCCELQDRDLRGAGMGQRFAFSPDGSTIASVSDENGVIVWDTRFHIRHVSPQFLVDYPSIVAASRDNKLLVSASYGDAIRLWDRQTGVKRQLYIHRLRPLVDMPLDPHWLKKFVPRSGSRFPDLIDYMVRKKINISSITFSIDGKFFACVWKTKKLQVWDAQSGKMLFTRKLDWSMSDNVVFSPDSKLIATFGYKICLWNTKTGCEAYSSTASLGKVEFVAFSPNGKYLVSSIPSKYDDDDFDDLEPSVHDHGDFYGYTHIGVTVEHDSPLEFSSNSKLLAYQFRGGIIVLNVETRDFVHTFTGHPSNLKKLSVFDNRYLGALHSSEDVFIWDLVTGSAVYKGGIRANESSSYFSLDDEYIALLDQISAYKTSLSANRHSTGISLSGLWIQDDGHDIVYFPHECTDYFDFVAASALVFRWPPTGFFGEATQHLGCNMLQFAMVDKVMDED